MELRQALLERRTVHAFTRDPVPDGAIRRALEAAVHAPNHRLTMPWRFLRVGRRTRERLVELALRLAAPQDGPPPKAQVDRVRAKILDPHELIVVSTVRDQDPLIAREDHAATSCAIQNLQLSLWSEGVASKWGTGTPTRHPDGYAILGIDPEREEIAGFVWVGMPKVIPAKPERPPAGHFVKILP